MLSIGNVIIPGQFREKFGEKDKYNRLAGEYDNIGLFLGNILYVFRAAMGDFSVYYPAIYLTTIENYLFWIIFFLILVLTNIIFLNFVIAEAGNSYNIVNSQIKQYIQQNKALLIDEAESMLPKIMRSDKIYPKYIISRQIDV